MSRTPLLALAITAGWGPRRQSPHRWPWTRDAPTGACPGRVSSHSLLVMSAPPAECDGGVSTPPRVRLSRAMEAIQGPNPRR